MDLIVIGFIIKIIDEPHGGIQPNKFQIHPSAILSFLAYCTLNRINSYAMQYIADLLPNINISHLASLVVAPAAFILFLDYKKGKLNDPELPNTVLGLFKEIQKPTTSSMITTGAEIGSELGTSGFLMVWEE